MKKLVVYYLDDWTGVYIDGKLLYQHHNFREDHVIPALGIDAEFIAAYDDYSLLMETAELVPEFEFDEGYPFPDKLEDWEKLVKTAREIQEGIKFL